MGKLTGNKARVKLHVFYPWTNAKGQLPVPTVSS